MSCVPGCKADVFISYAHRDNADGWVTRVKEKLTAKLNPFLSGRAEVWFDDRIAPGVYFKEEIQQKLKDIPIFIAVVSPSYLDSQFCILHELEWFQNQGGKDIIQLVKVPLEGSQDVPLPESAYTSLYDEKDGHLLDGAPLEQALDKGGSTRRSIPTFCVALSYWRQKELSHLQCVPCLMLSDLGHCEESIRVLPWAKARA